MFRIDNATNTASLPTPASTGVNPNGYFTGGDPGSGLPATVVTSDWANAVQEELCYPIEQSGLTLSKTDRGLLKKAIDFMIVKSVSKYAASSGTDTYTVTLTPAPLAYSTGMELNIKFGNANTGASTINVNGLGAKSIKMPNGSALLAGNIQSNHHATLIYDGTNFLLKNPYQLIYVKGSDLASASTVDLSTATGDFVDITGTTTITALGTMAAGSQKTLRFTGALTLTHNATSLILPTSANILTANGDTAIMRSLGSGNWKCIGYWKQDGTPLTVAGPFIDSSAIIKNASDTTKLLRISASNITTGQTRVITPPDYDLDFFVVQRTSTLSGAVATGTTTIPSDDTIPQITEGTEFMTHSHTPKKSTNVLVIDVFGIFAVSANSAPIMALFQDATANALSATMFYWGAAAIGSPAPLKIRHVMTAGGTSAITFRMRAGPDAAATITFNGSAGGRKLGGVMNSMIMVTEYSA